MPVVLAAVGGGIGIAGGVGQYFAGKNQAEAMQKIAQQQADLARQVIEMQRKDRETAVGYAAPSIEEMAQISKQLEMSMASLNSQLASIAKDEELLHAVDPALKEAGVQAYQLLKGQEAAALSPIRTERERQKQILRSSLRAQLGSGFETSSAGIEALNRFDQETAGVLQQAQDQTLQSFLGLAANIRPDVSGKIGRAYAGASQIGAVGLTGLQNVAGRKVSAFNQVPISYQNLVTTAGAGEIGNLVNAQTVGQLFGNIGQIGGAVAGAGIQSKLDTDRTASLLASFRGGATAPAATVPQPRDTNPITGDSLFSQPRRP